MRLEIAVSSLFFIIYLYHPSISLQQKTNFLSSFFYQYKDHNKMQSKLVLVKTTTIETIKGIAQLSFLLAILPIVKDSLNLLWIFILEKSNLLTLFLLSTLNFSWTFVLEKSNLLASFFLLTLNLSWTFISEKFNLLMSSLRPIDEFHSMLILILPLYIIIIAVIVLLFLRNDQKVLIKSPEDEEMKGVLKAKRNNYGHLIIKELNFVIDEIDKKTIIGKEDKFGKIIDLTKEDIEFCDKKGLKHM